MLPNSAVENLLTRAQREATSAILSEESTAESLMEIAENAAEFADQKKRVGLIGTGWYGKCDLFRLIQVAPVEVVALCDVDSARAPDFRKKYEKAKNFVVYPRMLVIRGNWIYLGPMILGGVATVLAGAWKFLGIGQPASEGPLDTLYALARRIRKASTEAELSSIEDEIDSVLKAERAKAARGDEGAVDATTLNVAAHRLENLIHDRRATVTEKPAIALVPREGGARSNDAIRAT